MVVTDMKTIHIATHPARARILELLGEGHNYAAEMARKLTMDPRVVKFHLSVLHRHKLIDGKFELTTGSGNPYAAKFWFLTDPGENVLSQIKKLRQP